VNLGNAHNGVVVVVKVNDGRRAINNQAEATASVQGLYCPVM
jgi:hypothetical protein